jgi:hypothetical protein
LPVDLDIARLSGRLRANANNAGRALHMADALMAATALAHGAILTTRNALDGPEKQPSSLRGASRRRNPERPARLWIVSLCLQ